VSTFRRYFAAVLLVGLSGLSATLAQSERGTITGTVHDSSGAVVPGASVRITNDATNVTIATSSNVSGEFTAPDLATGKYNLRVEKQGFRAFLLTGITVDAASTVRADANLEVG